MLRDRHTGQYQQIGYWQKALDKSKKHVEAYEHQRKGSAYIEVLIIVDFLPVLVSGSYAPWWFLSPGENGGQLACLLLLFLGSVFRTQTQCRPQETQLMQ
jgi:hypothetical protein